MNKGFNKKGLQVLTFAIFVIAIVALIYYSTAIAGFVDDNNSNQTTSLVTIRDDKGNIVSSDINILNYTNNTYNIEIIPEEQLINKIYFENLLINENIEFGLSEVTSYVAPAGIQFNKVYAIDLSNLEFTNSAITSTALGSELYKCKYWDFNLSLCLGSWEKIQDLTKNEEYILSLEIGDPGFAEGENISENNAPILLENISNIYLQKNTNKTINLSNYFYDEDNDILTYEATIVENVTVLILNETAILIPDENFTGTRNITFYAFDGINRIESNLVFINVTAAIPVKIEPDLKIVKKHFTLDEEPEFEFAYVKGGKAVAREKAKGRWETSEEIIETAVYNYKGTLTDIEAEIEKIAEGKFNIKLPKQRAFRAGLYSLKLKFVKDNVTYEQEQDFTWGVLAINTHKSIYLPYENAFIGIAVLDDQGHMVCDADVSLEITDPNNNKEILSTDNGKIKISPECTIYGVTNLPDYYTNYSVNEIGTYIMNLTAVTANGVRNILDEFIVQDSVDFDIARDGPTRIYPFVPYVMNFTIKANKNYSGLINEYVPTSFVIAKQNGLVITEIGDTKVLSWNVDLKQDDIVNLDYEFDAPDISPYLFTLGKLEIGTWSEARNWMIASDSPDDVEKFWESFEHNNPWQDNFTEGGGGDWVIETPSSGIIADGSYVAHSDGCTGGCWLTSRTIDLSGQTDCTLYFNYGVTKLDGPEENLSLYIYDGTGHYWEWSVTESTTGSHSIDLDTNYIMDSNFQIEFYTLQSVTSEFAEFDKVNITCVVAVGEKYIRNVSESITLTETIDRTGNLFRTETKSIIVTETIGRLGNFFRLDLSTFSLTELLLKIAGFPRFMLDIFQFTDSIARFGSFFRAILQNINITDLISRLAIFGRTILESINITDFIAKIQGFIKTITETLNINDFVSRLSSFSRTILESFNITDFISRLSTFFRTIIESFNIADFIFKLKTIPITIREITESFNIADFVSRLSTLSRIIAESINLTDFIAKLQGFFKIIIQTFNVNEFINRLSTLFRTITEFINIIDLLARFKAVVPKTILETLNINDFITRLSSFGRTILQSLKITDLLAKFKEVAAKTITESFNMADLVSRVSTSFRIILQSINVIDLISRLSTLSRTIAESINLTDFITRLQGFVKLITQTLNINDFISRFSTFVRSITETFSILEKIYYSSISRITRLITETLNINDFITRILSVFRLTLESFNISDLLAKFRAIPKAILETLNINDFVSRLLTLYRTILQPINITDLISRLSTLSRTSAESINLTDFITRLQGFVKLITQTLNINDFISRLASFRRKITETFSILEKISYSTITRVIKLITETLNIGDFITRISSLFRLVLESFNITDLLEKIKTVLKAISETLNINDFISRLAVFSRVILQSFNISDLISKLSSLSRIIVETINITDFITRIQGFVKIITQTLNINDFVSRLASFGRATLEGINITDLLAKFKEVALKAITETLNITDFIDRLTLFYRNVLESFDIIDLLAKFKEVAKTITETLNITDFINRLAIFGRSILQSININGFITRLANWYRSAIETLNITDFIIRLKGFVKLVSETLNISDFIARLGVFYRSIIETFNITDLINRLTTLFRTITETFNIADFITWLKTVPAILRTITESINIADFVSRLQSSFRILTQTLNINELINRLSTFFRTFLERFSIFDFISWLKEIFAFIPGPTGAGGGGRAARREIPSFTVSKDLIKVVLKQGETRVESLEIKNTGKTKLDFTVDLRNLKDFVIFSGGVSKYTFELEPEEEQTLQLIFNAAKDQEPGVYPGKVVIKGNGLQTIITTIVEVESERPVFDVDIEISADYKQIFAGEDVLAQIIIYNLKGIGKVDVKIEYAIKDTEGNIISEESEIIAVETQVSIIRSLTTPLYLRSGQYVLYVKVTYNGVVGTSSDVFEVVEKRVLGLPILLIWVIIPLILLIIIVTIILLHKRLVKLRPKKRRGEELIEEREKRIKNLIRQAYENNYTDGMILKKFKDYGYSRTYISKFLRKKENKNKKGLFL